MRAHQKFKIGQRVRMNDEGRSLHPFDTKSGVCVGFNSDFAEWITVESGLTKKRREQYNMDFWEPVK